MNDSTSSFTCLFILCSLSWSCKWSSLSVASWYSCLVSYSCEKASVRRCITFKLTYTISYYVVCMRFTPDWNVFWTSQCHFLLFTTTWGYNRSRYVSHLWRCYELTKTTIPVSSQSPLCDVKLESHPHRRIYTFSSYSGVLGCENGRASCRERL